MNTTASDDVAAEAPNESAIAFNITSLTSSAVVRDESYLLSVMALLLVENLERQHKHEHEHENTIWKEKQLELF